VALRTKWQQSRDRRRQQQRETDEREDGADGVNNEDDEKLEAPFDVKLVELVHMLNPTRYRAEIRTQHALTDENDWTFCGDADTAEHALAIVRLRRTCQLWQEEYPDSPPLIEDSIFEEAEKQGTIDYVDLSFAHLIRNIVPTKEEERVERKQGDRLFSISIKAIQHNLQWTAKFRAFISGNTSPQCPLPAIDFFSDDFLEHQRKAYEKFLFLCAKFPDANLTPTPSIDLFWHAHMAHPRRYEDACCRFGRFISHSIDITAEAMQKNTKETDQLWYNEFDEDIECFRYELRPSPIEDLSDEILLLIVSMLNTSDLGTISCVNTRFKRVSEDNSIWLNKLQKDFPHEQVDTSNPKRKLKVQYKRFLQKRKRPKKTSTRSSSSRSSGWGRSDYSACDTGGCYRSCGL